MKRLGILFLLVFCAVFVSAQQSSPPDILTSQGAAGASLVTYKLWLEDQITKLWTAEQTDVATLRTQINGLGSVSRPSATGYTLKVPAGAHCAGSSVDLVLVASSGADSGIKVALPSAAAFYDYEINVPQAANYVLSARVSVGSVGTQAWSAHFELPPGAPLAGATLSYVPSSTAWSTVVAPNAVPLQAGRQILRLAIDGPLPNSFLDWIRVVQQ